jgi:hypothetical protein
MEKKLYFLKKEILKVIKFVKWINNYKENS